MLGDGIRRNAATVTLEERRRLRDAILRLQDRAFPGNRTDTPAGGVSFWFKQDEIHQATHVHNGPAFLPWHREICNRFEAMLRQVDRLISLHYWDWTTDPRRSPDGTGGFVNLFTDEFMGSADGFAGKPWEGVIFDRDATPFRSDQFRNPGLPPEENQNPADLPRTLVRRVFDISIEDFDAELGIPSDQDILAASTFEQMDALLKDKHDSRHGYIGGPLDRDPPGTLTNPHLSFRDPFVFLLHSNVDRLFALWQFARGHRERLNPDLVYNTQSNSTGRNGILTLMEPWAGNADNDSQILRVRPWAPPENEHELEVNRKNSRHPSVVIPPMYDSIAISLRDVCERKGVNPASGIRAPMAQVNVTSVRTFAGR
jgi:Common central domain of tyrosinase